MRPPQSKPFAFNHDQTGSSIHEKFDQYEDFKEAKHVHSMCLLYANSYSEIMLKRLEAEKPEFYEENNITKRELVAHLANNMCLPYAKVRSKLMRDTSIKIKENDHLKEQIRRFANAGDRFHPYFWKETHEVSLRTHDFKLQSASLNEECVRLFNLTPLHFLLYLWIFTSYKYLLNY